MSDIYRILVQEIEGAPARFTVFDRPGDAGIPPSKFFVLSLMVEAWENLLRGNYWWFGDNPKKGRELEAELSPYQQLARDTPLFDELATLHDWYWGVPVDLSPEEFAEVGRTRRYRGFPINLYDRNNNRIEYQDWPSIREAAEGAIVALRTDNFQPYRSSAVESPREDIPPHLDLVFEVYEPKLLEFFRVGMSWKTTVYDDASPRWRDRQGKWVLEAAF